MSNWMCVFGRVSLSALWWVLGKYWICVFGKFRCVFYGGYSVSIGCVYLVRFR